MILFKEANHLSHYLQQLKQDGKTIGFVPTMGALHQGHLSLITQSREKAAVSVCSIFVNPTQFNNSDDFEKYPITIEQDIEKLTSSGCDILFLPSAAEIYPGNYQAPQYDLGKLELVLEGRYRPGHFQGVCQVVDRLLQIVDPDLLLMGEKDYQQCKVVQKLLELTGRTSPTLVIAPTIREEDGLAMSSRNLRLSKEQRGKAPALFAALASAKKELGTKNIDKIKTEAIQHLTQKGFQVDYFEIADATTLCPAHDDSRTVVALVAAYLDDIRLIDNLTLN